MFKFNGTRKPDFKNINKIDYDNYWRQRGVKINSKLKEREEIIFDKIPTQSKILDIGCGSSRLPLDLKEKGCNVVVSDISPVILDEFTKLNVKTIVMDLEKTSSLENIGQYDYIILSEVLEHMYNPEEIIDRLSSHTKYFVLTIPNSAFYRYRIHLMFFGRFFTQWVVHPSEHIRYWSHKDFLDWIKDMGLKLQKSESSNGLYFLGLPIYKWWPNMFGHQIVYICEVD